MKQREVVGIIFNQNFKIMKIIHLQLALVFLLFSFALSSQTIVKGTEITAIKLGREQVEQYYNKIAFESFTLNSKGVLRANEKFRIVYLQDTKQWAVIPQGRVMPKEISGYAEMKVPGGTKYCMCDGGPGDNCKLEPMVTEKTIYYHCEGSCGCDEFIIWDISTPILGYETAGGKWY